MIRHTRRDALVRIGLGSAGLLVGCRDGTRVRPADTSAIEPLAESIRACSRDGVYDVAAKAIRAGADPSTLLAACFLAGVRDIRPHGVGGKFHAVLMVESAYQLAALSSIDDAYRVALWTLWDFKRCQERDREEEGDWVLPPRPDVSFGSASVARREFDAAMAAWDVERADRAIVGLLAYYDHTALFELIWPYGIRCYADLGHKIIFCAHADRTLRRVGWAHAEPVLRSLVRGLLYVTDRGPETGIYDDSLALVDRVPADWLDGREEDPLESLELLRALRGEGTSACQQVVLDALAARVGIATIWDGLRLLASELFYRRAPAAERRHLPVHTVTELNAFAHVFRSTSDAATRKLVLLQITGWLAQLGSDFERLVGEPRTVTLEELGRARAETPRDLREVFEQPSADGACRAIDELADGTSRYLALLRDNLHERAFQDHQYKFVAALHEESAAIAPRWRSRLLAPAITYVPAGRDPRTEMRRRSDAALVTAGII